MLKEEIVTLDEAVIAPADTPRYEIGAREGLPYEGVLYVKLPSRRPPWWLAFLRAARPELEELLNASTAAVLVLEAMGRKFAVTFGYGRNLLRLDAFERDFGLRVALNVIDPRTLRSVDARTFEELTLMTRSQTSRATSLENFRLSRIENILKAVTGTPRNADFAVRITGADAARITYVPDLAGLGRKCEELLVAYGSDDYKQEFNFIDDLKVERDPATINNLNQELLRRLQERDFGSLHLAPPEVLDVQDIDAFVIDGGEGEGVIELEIEDYLALAGNALSLTDLRRRRVGTVYPSAAEPHFRWTVYDCLVVEIRAGRDLYVLSGGTWYKVTQSFAERVAQFAEEMVGEADLLPAAGETEEESAYNIRAAAAKNYDLLDQKLVTPPGGRTPIEFCDLLAGQKLVHVKRRSRSATLSHLFSQGLVSAETFLRDAGFRRALADKLREGGLTRAADLVTRDRIAPHEWEVVYAIVGGGVQGWPRSLPFFSQLYFKIAAERLGVLGYSVSLVHVPVQ